MPPKIKCPVCNSELNSITAGHIKSKKHQNALINKGIKPSEDPALKMIAPKKKPQKKSSNQELLNIKNRLFDLENAVKIMQNQQKLLLKQLNLTDRAIESPITKSKALEISNKEVLGAIQKCIQNNKDGSRWIMIDDIISILKLNREEDRNRLNKNLIKLFNQNVIDLSEGGDPKYPLIYQNRIFGMVTLQ